MFGGINVWRRNSTYIPAVLVNLFNKGLPEKPLVLALQGVICIAKILSHYASESVRMESDTPLCFNGLAGLASFNLEYFDGSTFTVDHVGYDERSNVVCAVEGAISKAQFISGPL